MTSGAIGLIAGGGQYPVQLSRRLLAEGYQVVVAGIAGSVDASEYRDCYYKHFYIGQIKAACAWFRRWGVTKSIMAGGIRLRWGTVITPDISLLPVMPRLLLGGDDWRLRYLASSFEKQGVAVIGPHLYISDWFAEEGHLAGPLIDGASECLLARGISECTAFVQRDVGQAVVVHGQNWIAREDRRGTNALIRKTPGKGAILVKMKKKGQDLRFDIPAVGPDTVHQAHKYGITIIAVQAGTVMRIEKEKMMRMCRELGVSLMAFNKS